MSSPAFPAAASRRWPTASYGDKLFDDYEQRFLKRNVQGELVSRALSPRYWGALSSEGWGRSELASQLYDEILFNGATFGDLNRGKGPMILASATDISTGSRFVFNQGTFDIICSTSMPCRCPAPPRPRRPCRWCSPSITIKNYGGTCNWTPPAMGEAVPRQRQPAATCRTGDSIAQEPASVWRQRSAGPISISSTAACRTTSACAACSMRWKSSKRCTRPACRRHLDSAKRIIVFVVNSLSSPPTNWDESY